MVLMSGVENVVKCLIVDKKFVQLEMCDTWEIRRTGK